MAAKTVIKKTAKKKKVVVLPSLRDIVFIPNKVTEAQYDYTLIQERIFNFIMFNLQEAIKLNMNGGNYQQLEMFTTVGNTVKIVLPLKNIALPQQYNDVRASAKQLASIVVGIPYTEKGTGRKYTKYQGLFKVSVPDEISRTSDLLVEMDKEVAKLLVELELNNNGKPKGYTSFILQVAIQSKNKYTSRIYKKISSWKEKGGFYMTIQEFRDWLQLGDKYPTYGDLKKRILVPVQQELEGKADCWFNCAETSFEKRDGKTVVGLNFKVIKPVLEQEREIHVDATKNMLRIHFGFKEDDIKQLEPIFRHPFNHTRVSDTLLRLNEYLAANKAGIGNPKAYIIKSLLKEHSNP